MNTSIKNEPGLPSSINSFNNYSITHKAEMIDRYLDNLFCLTQCKGKIPVNKNWTKTPYDPCLTVDDFPDNYGVVLQSDHLVIDVDPRNFKFGDELECFKKLIGDNLGNTFTVKTGGNGLHYYYYKPEGLKIQGKLDNFSGIEFKTEGQQVLGPGSIHPETNKLYEVESGNLNEIREAPKGLLNLIQKTAFKIEGKGVDSYKDDEGSIKRYTTYLKDSAPLAIEGEGGDNTTFKVACRGRDYALSPEKTFELMLEHWNGRCSPPWDIDELKKKVHNAYTYNSDVIGKNHPGNDFKPTVYYSKSDSSSLNGLNGEFSMKDFDRTEKGSLKCNCINTTNLFKLPDSPLFKLVGKNLFTGDIEFLKLAPWHKGKSKIKTITDEDITLCKHYIGSKYYCDGNHTNRYIATKEDLWDAFIKIAQENSFHPVQEYFQSIQWDGIKRLDKWLVHYCGAEDTKRAEKISVKILVAAVARIFEPGVKFDHVLILEGKQGIGKSTLCKILGGEWYGDFVIDLKTIKDVVEPMRGKWIIEMSELDALKKNEISRMKCFITCSEDRVRLPYKRISEDFPRQSIFIGTVNPESIGYLNDTTGGRRFWPVKIEFVNIEALKEDRDQLFAEALNRYKNGEKIYLDNEADFKLFAEEVDKRTQEDNWLEIIDEYTNKTNDEIGQEVFTTNEIATNCLHISVKDLHPQGTHIRRIATCLHQLGFERGKFKHPLTGSYIKAFRKEFEL